MSDEDDKKKKAEVFLFNLTDMTGKNAKAGRSVVILTVEMRRGTLIASIVSLIPALLVSLLFLPLLGVWTLMVGIVAFAAGMFFFTFRQRRGLQLQQWRGWADKRRSRTDVFIQCNRVIDPAQSETRNVIRSARPNPFRVDIDDETLTDKVLAL